MLEDYAKQSFGAETVERLDSSTPAAQRHTAIQRFNAPDSPGFLFLMATRSCGLGTNLPTISTVIMHDSDWNPCLDIQVRLASLLLPLVACV